MHIGCRTFTSKLSIMLGTPKETLGPDLPLVVE
jgi:hypothetical protein